MSIWLYIWDDEFHAYMQVNGPVLTDIYMIHESTPNEDPRASHKASNNYNIRGKEKVVLGIAESNLQIYGQEQRSLK